MKPSVLFICIFLIGLSWLPLEAQDIQVTGVLKPADKRYSIESQGKVYFLTDEKLFEEFKKLSGRKVVLKGRVRKGNKPRLVSVQIISRGGSEADNAEDAPQETKAIVVAPSKKGPKKESPKKESPKKEPKEKVEEEADYDTDF